MCFKKHEQHKRWLMNQSWNINMKNKVGDKVLPPADSSFRDRLHIIQLQKLCHLKDRVEELQRHLRTCCIVSQQCNDNHSRQAQIVYVPVPDVREKVWDLTMTRLILFLLHLGKSKDEKIIWYCLRRSKLYNLDKIPRRFLQMRLKLLMLIISYIEYRIIDIRCVSPVSCIPS